MDNNYNNKACLCSSIENSIDEEISDFVQELYIKIEEIAKKELYFIEINRLIIPKENYLFLFDFLDSLLNSFIKIDYEIETPLIKKLYQDIKLIQKLHHNYKDIHLDMYQIFNKRFLHYSNILRYLKRNLTDQKTRDDYKKLKLLYYEKFLNQLEYKRKENSMMLLSVLNSKIFYFDRLIWKEANKSFKIEKYLDIIGIQYSVNSKEYLGFRLKDEINSKNYLYLEKCLRVYK